MRTIRTRVLVFTTVAAAAAVAFPASAAACSCVPLDEDQALGRADGAVIAKAVDQSPAGKGGMADYRLKVFEVFKGGIDPDKKLIVRSADNGAACGIEAYGRRVGLFLERGRERWRSNLCAQTTPGAMRRAANGADNREGGTAGNGAVCGAPGA